MKRKLLDIYTCPTTHTRLTPKISGAAGSDEVKAGELVSAGGASYPIVDGVPHFLSSSMLSKIEADTQNEYEAVAEKIYDTAVDWLFASFYEDEDKVREGMIDLLELKRGSRVLEIGCGTGRDSFRIARRIGTGEFYVQDLSPKMVYKTRDRLEADRTRLDLSCEVHPFVSTARQLPFPDGHFDAVFHFGGFNNFEEKKTCMAEMARITRKGGKVVVGDESVPPWLEGTEFGEIVTTNNAMFEHKAPLDCLPPNARNVCVRWVLGGCFYLIEFAVGEGTPPLNLDLPHEGWRGGTMRTRYFGRLEGVTIEAKKMAVEAAKKSGKSVHEWLDALVRQAAGSSGKKS
jgi:ubiquinone/menaquinone biosynthesis C-methylase UbiE